MTPQEVEARLAVQDGQPDSATVAAVLDELRADPDWTVTEITVTGRLVLVELAYGPTGVVYTLSSTPTDCVGGPNGHDRCPEEQGDSGP